MNKKNILIVALAITSLTLFSFRGTENISNEAEITDVKEFTFSAKNFSETCEIHTDKFERWRRDWVDYETLSQMSISLDEMNATLEGF